MRRIVAVILISLLVAPPALADQKPGKPITWKKAQQLKAGTEVWLTVKDSPPAKVKVLFADDLTLVTLKPGTAKLPDRVERVVLTTGSHWPDILYRGGSFTRGHVRVSQDRVVDGDRKVGDLTQTPRGNVLSIQEAATQPPHSHWVRNILIAVGVAIVTMLVIMATVPYFQS